MILAPIPVPRVLPERSIDSVMPTTGALYIEGHPVSVQYELVALLSILRRIERLLEEIRKRVEAL